MNTNGLKNLEETEREFKKKLMETDIKIPELFILAIPAIIVFLSTIPGANRNIFYWVSLISFSITIFLSASALFDVKELFRDSGSLALQGLRAIRKASKQVKLKKIGIGKLKKILERICVKSEKLAQNTITKRRTRVDYLLRLTFKFFVLGLITMILSIIMGSADLIMILEKIKTYATVLRSF